MTYTVVFQFKGRDPFTAHVDTAEDIDPEERVAIAARAGLTELAKAVGWEDRPVHEIMRYVKLIAVYEGAQYNIAPDTDDWVEEIPDERYDPADATGDKDPMEE